MTARLPLDLKYFKDLVQERTGLTFDRTREEILRRKVAEAMEQRGYRSRAELYSALRNDEVAFLEFVNHLTINETYFFREPQYLQLLTDHLVPGLLAGKKAGEKIKIISAGCSTGEEPYSIAIALWEKFAEKTSDLFAIVGADLNSLALEKAEGGVFGKLSFRGCEELVRSRYFEPSRFGLFKIKTAVRGLVQFVRFNLLSEHYPRLLGKADVVFYRNVSIYFDPPTQRKILTSLASIVNAGGYVVFSASETFSHKDVGALSLIESQGLFYYQKLSQGEAHLEVCNPSVLAADSTGSWRSSENAKARSGGKTAGRVTATMAVCPAEKPAVARVSSGVCGFSPAAAPEVLFQEALVCFRRKEHGRAFQLAERLQECKGYRAKAYLLGGCVLLNREKIQEAGELFGKALKMDALDLEAHLLLGLTAKNSGETDRAIKCFSKALYVQNSCWMAHYFLAEIYLSIGNAKKALGFYGTLLKIIESTAVEKSNLIFFPISFKREDLLHLCRRKIAAISETNYGI
ncbi:MAG: tetratricopeptide repeat protein [Desulfobulbaceae bacterium]|nr:tetratricopeptide repeat protein [Desulfobulbaceae bacterium]